MSQQPIEWVVYDPPKSAVFGHRMRFKTTRKAWQRVAEFLQNVDDIAVNPYSETKLTCYLPPATNERIALERISQAELEFGAPTDRHVHDQPQGNSYVRWLLRADQIEQGVEFALDDDQYPEQVTGPTGMDFSFRFNWRQFPKSVADQFGRQPRNGISITIGKSILGRGIFLQPSFQIPCAWNSPEFRAFLHEVEPMLPFKPSDNNFKRLLLPRTPQTLGRQRKLEKGWRKQWLPH